MTETPYHLQKHTANTHASVTKIYKHNAYRSAEALEQMALLFLDRKEHNQIIRVSQNTLYADMKVNTTTVNNGNQQVQIPEDINSTCAQLKTNQEQEHQPTRKKKPVNRNEGLYGNNEQVHYNGKAK